jgi:hypothetical protein
MTGRLSGGLLDKVEGDRADQHACPEAHDQSNHGQTYAEAKRDDGADHE